MTYKNTKWQTNIGCQLIFIIYLHYKLFILYIDNFILLRIEKWHNDASISKKWKKIVTNIHVHNICYKNKKNW